MVKYFNNDRTQNKFGMQKSGIQKRSFNNRAGSGGRDGGGSFAKKSKYAMAADDLTIPDWNSVTLKPFKKDFYVPHVTVEQRYFNNTCYTYISPPTWYT